MAEMNLTIDEFLAYLKRQQGDRTDKEFAESLGVSPQYMCDIYMGRRVPGDRIIEPLGATRRLVYTINSKEKKKLVP